METQKSGIGCLLQLYTCTDTLEEDPERFPFDQCLRVSHAFFKEACDSDLILISVNQNQKASPGARCGCSHPHISVTIYVHAHCIGT